MKSSKLIVLALTLLATGTPTRAANSKAKVVRAGGFDVIGISVRTSNRAETGPHGKIGKLWQQVYSSNVIERIPNKTDQGESLALYYDYESDKDGEYSYMIGARVSSTAEVPEGMSAVHVPAGRFAVFTTDRGPAAKVVPEAWRRIWAVPKSEPGGDRAYKVDYEVYDERAKDPENAQVDIYIGMK